MKIMFVVTSQHTLVIRPELSTSNMRNIFSSTVLGSSPVRIMNTVMNSWKLMTPSPLVS